MLLEPLLFSAAITASQTISKTISLSVLDTSVMRFASIGTACAVYLMLSPSKITASYTTIMLSIFTGFILFSASALYIHLVRTNGIVATCLTTTAFSFVFTLLAGYLFLKESITLKTMISMGIVLSGLSLYHI